MFDVLSSATILATVFICGLIAAMFRTFPPQNLDQAVAWATALGTIALVGVGVLVPVFQSHDERRQRDSVKKDARAALRRIVFQAHRLVHTEIGHGILYKTIKFDKADDRVPNYRGAIKRKASAITDLLGRVEFNQLVETRTVEPLFRVQSAMTNLLGHVDYWEWNNVGIPKTEKASGHQFQDLKDDLQYALDVFDGKKSIIIDALDEPARLDEARGIVVPTSTPDAFD